MSNGHSVATVPSDRMSVSTMLKVPIFSPASNLEGPGEQFHLQGQVKVTILFQFPNGMQP